MLRRVQYAVALFIFTGSIGLASPYQFENPLSGLSSFGYGTDIMDQEPVKQLLKDCPDDPQIKEKIRDALNSVRSCVPSMPPVPDVRLELLTDTERESVRFYCRTLKDLKQCVQRFVSAAKMCLRQVTEEQVMKAYEEGITILCSDDGKKFVGAISEIREEKRECLNEITSEIRSCPEKVEYNEIKDNIAACRQIQCLKNSLNVCGGPKPKVNEIVDEVMQAASAHLDCVFSASARTAHPAAALLFSLLALLLTARPFLRPGLF